MAVGDIGGPALPESTLAVSLANKEPAVVMVGDEINPFDARSLRLNIDWRMFVVSAPLRRLRG